jgi:hypothetical protein
MPDVYEEMMRTCRRIADSFPQPRFYGDCVRELNASRRIFTGDAVVLRCLETISDDLRDNYGHGLDHARKVAIEAGALALMEQERLGLTDSPKDRIGVLAQLAGLIHDLRRGEKNHAKRSALAAGPILDAFSIAPDEKMYIIEAIANHEAFVEPTTPDSSYGQMLSDVLYDADKFRWGPDNFTLTLWEMLRSKPVPMSMVIRRFPQGMAGIERIKGAFRSQAGKTFGPEFINLGLKIGERIYQYLRERFADEADR